MSDARNASPGEPSALPVEIATERYAREDTEVVGTTIPCGELVLAAIGSANHDERQFERPDQLDLGGEPKTHLSLEQGIHYWRASEVRPGMPREI